MFGMRSMLTWMIVPICVVMTFVRLQRATVKKANNSDNNRKKNCESRVAQQLDMGASLRRNTPELNSTSEQS
ncbi:hypothetical protein DICVIV_05407 [Dictyocaulus viviparus]|uniref:Secreted protein n=1 Tax=Dictyocaulus viviparus TaxID=29172 RepID=A0A0D8Y1L7_DICVI|nr:hypothetical protein DICVIV_05407 [Dictyocaulus viviparus]